MKHIYKSTRVLPYVYMCKEKNGPNFYIGYRFANYVPSTEDFGTHYFTSNEYVKNNFDPYLHRALLAVALDRLHAAHVHSFQ